MSTTTTYCKNLKLAAYAMVALLPVTCHLDSLSTHVTQGLVLHTSLLDHLSGRLEVNSTELNDNQGLKRFNFEFVILIQSIQWLKQGNGLQSFFRRTASTQLSSQLAKQSIQSKSPESEVSGMICAEDQDSAFSQSSPPKSDSSPVNQEMST